MVARSTTYNRLALACSLVLCLLSFAAHAQLNLNNFTTNEEKKHTRTGNSLYTDKNYADAETEYKKALDKKDSMLPAVYNLGSAIYRQRNVSDSLLRAKRDSTAIAQYELSARINPDPAIKAHSYYNAGNVYLSQKNWEQAIDEYKKSLKINGRDSDAKYNLAYANIMLAKQKSDAKANANQNKDNKDNKQQKGGQGDNKQQQNKRPDSGDDNKGKQGQDKQNQGDKDGQKKGTVVAVPMTKEKAEKMLQALMNEEKKTNQKVQQKQMKVPAGAKPQKDW